MDVMVGRQPIFDLNKNVFAYELLFRGGFNSIVDDMDNFATADVIRNALFHIGFNDLTEGKLAFINFSKDLLTKGIPSLLPKNSTVIEILEHVEPDNEIISICKKLKSDGYTIALDDFVFNTEKFYELFPFIDIIKIDFKITDREKRRELVEKLKQFSFKLLAEKVETIEEYEEAKNLGCAYFQGFFFKKPDTVQGKELVIQNSQTFSILQALNQYEIDFDIIEEIMRKEPAISYKLLRLINSAATGVKNEVKSIKQALVILGIDNLRKWLHLIILKEFQTDAPKELIKSSLIRAYFCETLAIETSLKDRSSECFLLGMFSLMDVLTSTKMEKLVDSLPFERDLLDALAGKRNEFRDLLNVIIAYEESDWRKLSRNINKVNCSEDFISQLYMDAIHWAHDLDLE